MCAASLLTSNDPESESETTNLTNNQDIPG
jgi:hypothetical protein